MVMQLIHSYPVSAAYLRVCQLFANSTGPVLGQGAAQAMEDGVSIAVLLQQGTKSSEIKPLVKLYDQIRRERVNYIQEKTRINGRDEGKGRLTRKSTSKAL